MNTEAKITQTLRTTLEQWYKDLKTDFEGEK